MDEMEHMDEMDTAEPADISYVHFVPARCKKIIRFYAPGSIRTSAQMAC
jgi:hypothetical protein